MSESTRAAVVRSLYERVNKSDYNGITDNFTDDFIFQLEPPPVGLAGYTVPGITKDKFVEYQTEVAKEHKDHETIIESIHEDGDKITLKGRHKFSHKKCGTDEHSFHAEVIFKGDKIQLFKTTIDDPAFLNRWQEYL